MHKRLVGALAATALCLLVPACSSSGGGGSANGLAAAMSTVSVAGISTPEIEWGDMARLRALGVVDPAGLTDRSKQLIDPKWNEVVGWGTGALSAASVVLPDRIGLNVFTADTAIFVGPPPTQAVQIDGHVDDDAVHAKLTALGAKARDFDGTAGLSFGADNQAVTKLSDLGVVSALDQVVAKDSSFAASPSAAGLARVLHPDHPASHTDFGAAANCLGDVLAAEIHAEPAGGVTQLAAVGVRDPGTATGTRQEVVCYLPTKGDEAKVKASVTKNLALSGTSARTRLTISAFATKSTIDESNGLVRATLTMRSNRPAGFVLESLGGGDVEYWSGQCTDADIQKHPC